MYLARHKRTSEQFAVKVLSKEDIRSKNLVDQGEPTDHYHHHFLCEWIGYALDVHFRTLSCEGALREHLKQIILERTENSRRSLQA